MIFNVKDCIEPADYVIEEGIFKLNTITWRHTKWASGKSEAYMVNFYDYGNLNMTAKGNLYLSEERYVVLPADLFIDTSYHVSTEIQSSSGPVSVVRQSTSISSQYRFKIYKVFNSATAVSLKFRIIGRWK